MKNIRDMKTLLHFFVETDLNQTTFRYMEDDLRALSQQDYDQVSGKLFDATQRYHNTTFNFCLVTLYSYLYPYIPCLI